MTLADAILEGDNRALARAASLMEAQTVQGRELSKSIFHATGRALTIGITGPPGVGKSMLVNQLIHAYRRFGKTVGVLAVDPSSPYSNGALLGDRVRMLDHHADPGVFIRSMASRGRLGGVASATLDLMLLLDAAGLNIIFIETVGVGQDEVDVAHLAEITILVLAPGAGDDIQAIKAGVLEVADLLVVNKADLSGADRLQADLLDGQRHAGAEVSAVPVMKVSASEKTGLTELMVQIAAAAEWKQDQTMQLNGWIHRLRFKLTDEFRTEIPLDLLARHAEKVCQRSEDPQSAIMTLREEWLARQKDGPTN